MPFHIKTGVARHVELHNVAKTLMDQSQDQEPRIHVVQDRLRSTLELRGQLDHIVNKFVHPFNSRVK